MLFNRKNHLHQKNAVASVSLKDRADQGISVIAFTKRIQFALAVACFLVQFLILPEWLNVACSFLLCAGSLVVLSVILNEETVKRYVVSSFSLWAVTITMLWGPLCFTTFEWKPVIFRLRVPIETFAWSLGVVLSLIIGHCLYRNLASGGTYKVRKLWSRMGVFVQPDNLTIWVFGALGYVASWYSFVYKQVEFYSNDDVGTLGKLIQGLIPFTAMPFYLLYKHTAREEVEKRASLLPIFIYLSMLVLLGVFSNTRGVFAGPIFTCILGFIMLGFSGLMSISRRHLTLVFWLLPVGFFAMIQLADLAMAMRFSRSARGTASALEVASSTIAIFRDKESLRDLRGNMLSEGESSVWNEYYVDNPFVSRLLATPFIDNSMVLVREFGPSERVSLWGATIQQMLSIFPGPIRARIPIEGSKESATGYSMGDYLYYLAYGQLTPDYKGGSAVAHGVALLGYYFPVVIVFFSVPVFIFFDSYSFYRRSRPPRRLDAASSRHLVRVNYIHFAPLALVGAYDFFVFWSVESVSVMFVGLVRGILQRTVLYCVVLFIIQRNRRGLDE